MFELSKEITQLQRDSKKKLDALGQELEQLQKENKRKLDRAKEIATQLKKDQEQQMDKLNEKLAGVKEENDRKINELKKEIARVKSDFVELKKQNALLVDKMNKKLEKAENKGVSELKNRMGQIETFLSALKQGGNLNLAELPAIANKDLAVNNERVNLPGVNHEIKSVEQKKLKCNTGDAEHVVFSDIEDEDSGQQNFDSDLLDKLLPHSPQGNKISHEHDTEGTNGKTRTKAEDSDQIEAESSDAKPSKKPVKPKAKKRKPVSRKDSVENHDEKDSDCEAVDQKSVKSKLRKSKPLSRKDSVENQDDEKDSDWEAEQKSVEPKVKKRKSGKESVENQDDENDSDWEADQKSVKPKVKKRKPLSRKHSVESHDEKDSDSEVVDRKPLERKVKTRKPLSRKASVESRDEKDSDSEAVDHEKDDLMDKKREHSLSSDSSDGETPKKQKSERTSSKQSKKKKKVSAVHLVGGGRKKNSGITKQASDEGKKHLDERNLVDLLSDKSVSKKAKQKALLQSKNSLKCFRIKSSIDEKISHGDLSSCISMAQEVLETDDMMTLLEEACVYAGSWHRVDYIKVLFDAIKDKTLIYDFVKPAFLEMLAFHGAKYTKAQCESWGISGHGLDKKKYIIWNSTGCLQFLWQALNSDQRNDLKESIWDPTARTKFGKLEKVLSEKVQLCTECCTSDQMDFIRGADTGADSDGSASAKSSNHQTDDEKHDHVKTEDKEVDAHVKIEDKEANVHVKIEDKEATGVHEESDNVSTSSDPPNIQTDNKKADDDDGSASANDDDDDDGTTHDKSHNV